ncbi:MAG: hypothetical protein AAFY71_04310 [Bacteroidota bacterium]
MNKNIYYILVTLGFGIGSIISGLDHFFQIKEAANLMDGLFLGPIFLFLFMITESFFLKKVSARITSILMVVGVALSMYFLMGQFDWGRMVYYGFLAVFVFLHLNEGFQEKNKVPLQYLGLLAVIISLIFNTWLLENGIPIISAAVVFVWGLINHVFPTIFKKR